MADTTTANVVKDRVWTEGSTTGKQRIGMIARLTDMTAGGNTNKITAESFGLRVIESCSSAIREDNSAIYPASPSYDGSYLVLGDFVEDDGPPVVVTEAPGDVVLSSSQFLRLEVHGYV